ncbi:MAG: hypothetical protein PF572_03670 [Patescibacteria group bacterium]|jgi:hypothetical protein|nr:hypothetical protein [Patescibacteria group bacterium]
MSTLINRVKKIAINSDLSDVEQMLSRQNFNGMPSFTYKIEGGFVGWLGGGSCDQKENLLIMAGEPINGPDILKINDYHDAVRLLPEFDGAFNAVFFDRINRKLVIVSDFLGLQPLYVKSVDKPLVASGNSKTGIMQNINNYCDILNNPRVLKTQYFQFCRTQMKLFLMNVYYRVVKKEFKAAFFYIYHHLKTKAHTAWIKGFFTFGRI